MPQMLTEEGRWISTGEQVSMETIYRNLEGFLSGISVLLSPDGEWVRAYIWINDPESTERIRWSGEVQSSGNLATDESKALRACLRKMEGDHEFWRITTNG